jgi:ABC-type multidrug transport system ATPase subunit
MQEFSGGWKMRVELGKILLQNPDLFFSMSLPITWTLKV